MSHVTLRSTFLRQLRFWAFHCSLNALPSLCIALFFMRLWHNPSAVAAMFCAILTFILLYSTLTSLPGPLANGNHMLSRSLRLGAKIRGWISGFSILLIWSPVAFLSPDLWCGMFAINIFNDLAGFLGYNNSFGGKIPSAASSLFFPVYVVTLLEGFILSFLLLLISFFSVIFLQSRGRRDFFIAEEKRRVARLQDQHPGLPDLDV